MRYTLQILKSEDGKPSEEIIRLSMMAVLTDGKEDEYRQAILEQKALSHLLDKLQKIIKED